MTLERGSRLGPYEVVGPIGAGGMGEVYRARDTRLDRSVAIKILPLHLSEDHERRQRFEREAKLISSLAHPHICTLHDVGHQDGIDFLVMEHLQGETLAERLRRGPLGLDQTLRLGVEIADALDKAHARGIVHRDLKPANIMLTANGAKLLDFGLAKVDAHQPGHEGSLLSAQDTRGRDLTSEGTLLGTLGYMAPEQLEGRAVDARTDIFALGVLIYQAATGRRAFEGRSQASLIASILSSEPAPMSAPIPASLDRLVRICLAKNPDERWQSAHDVAAMLRWMWREGVAWDEGARRQGRVWKLAAAAAGVIAVLLAIGLGAALRRGTTASATGSVRFAVQPEAGTRLTEDGLALSPDGRSLVFSAADPDGTVRLWLRRLADPVARPLAVAAPAAYPFWSPDGRSVGFFAKGQMLKVSVAGGPPQPLASAPNARGAAWGRDGTILFAPGLRGGLLRVPAEGGAPAPATKLDPSRVEFAHRFPCFLPDGQQFLFVAVSPKRESRGIYLGRLGSEQTTRLGAEVSTPGFAPPNRLLFSREDLVLAQDLSLGKGRLEGEIASVAEGLYSGADVIGLSAFSYSAGVLAWRTGGFKHSRLAFFDRSGRETAEAAPPGAYNSFALAPDGTRIAASLVDASGFSDLWLIDLKRHAQSRLTTDAANSVSPVWSADGKRLAFASLARGKYDVLVQDGSAVGAAQALASGDTNQVPQDLSPDGRVLLFARDDGTAGDNDLFATDLPAGAAPLSVVVTPAFSEEAARFSPDGRFVAYQSNESGRIEVYVRRYPPGPERWTISSGGGTGPVWRADGHELFYLAPDARLMAVDTRAALGRFEVGPPRLLFKTAIPESQIGRTVQALFSVAPDGQRFLLRVPVEDPAAQRLLIDLGVDLRAGQP